MFPVNTRPAVTHRLSVSVTVIPFPGSRRPVKPLSAWLHFTDTQTVFFNKAACYCPRYAVVVELICFQGVRCALWIVLSQPLTSFNGVSISLLLIIAD